MRSEVGTRPPDETLLDPCANDVSTHAEMRRGAGHGVPTIRVLVRKRAHARAIWNNQFDSVLSARPSNQFVFPCDAGTGAETFGVGVMGNLIIVKTSASELSDTVHDFGIVHLVLALARAGDHELRDGAARPLHPNSCHALRYVDGVHRNGLDDETEHGFAVRYIRRRGVPYRGKIPRELAY